MPYACYELRDGCRPFDWMIICRDEGLIRHNSRLTHSIEKVFNYVYTNLNFNSFSLVLSLAMTICFGRDKYYIAIQSKS